MRVESAPFMRSGTCIRRNASGATYAQTPPPCLELLSATNIDSRVLIACSGHHVKFTFVLFRPEKLHACSQRRYLGEPVSIGQTVFVGPLCWFTERPPRCTRQHAIEVFDASGLLTPKNTPTSVSFLLVFAPCVSVWCVTTWGHDFGVCQCQWPL